MIYDSLRVLGLTQGETQLYEALIMHGKSSVSELAEHVSISRRNTYDILKELQRKDLIAKTKENTKKYYKVRPPQQVKHLIEEKKEKLSAIEDILPEIQKSSENVEGTPTASTYIGVKPTKNVLEEILDYKKSLWLGGNSFQNYTAVSKHLIDTFHHWMRRREEEGHKMFDLVDHETFLEPFPENTQHYKRRELPEDFKSPLVIVIFGTTVLQILWKRNPFIIRLDGTAFKKSYEKYFWYLWDEGKEKKL